jgi:hypothetical protein
MIGGTVGPGMRNQRLTDIAKHSYDEAVRYARQHIYVNLYDVEEGRGWLLDGASVMIHLSRTQLSHQDSPHSRNPALILQALHLATSADGAKAAVTTLTDEHNMNL